MYTSLRWTSMIPCANSALVLRTWQKNPPSIFLRKKRSGVGSLHPGPVGDEPWLAIAAEYGAGFKILSIFAESTLFITVTGSICYFFHPASNCSSWVPALFFFPVQAEASHLKVLSCQPIYRPFRACWFVNCPSLLKEGGGVFSPPAVFSPIVFGDVTWTTWEASSSSILFFCWMLDSRGGGAGVRARRIKSDL